MARSPTPRESRAAASVPTATVARKASQRRRASGAAEAQQRRRDRHRRQARRATTRSMWREIFSQAPASRAMWACCADSLSDKDEHNTSNTLLLLFAEAFVAPALLSDLREVDELMVALSCRFTLDMFTIAQQDLNMMYAHQQTRKHEHTHEHKLHISINRSRNTHEQDKLHININIMIISKTGLDLNPFILVMILDVPLVLRHGVAWGSRRQHGWTCIFFAFLTLPLGLLKVALAMNDPRSLAAKDDSVALLSAFTGT